MDLNSNLYTLSYELMRVMKLDLYILSYELMWVMKSRKFFDHLCLSPRIWGISK